MKIAIGIVGALGLWMAGCGESSSSSYCCVNGAYYSCSSSSDVSACQDKCSRDSSKDSKCNTNNPETE